MFTAFCYRKCPFFKVAFGIRKIPLTNCIADVVALFVGMPFYIDTDREIVLRWN